MLTELVTTYHYELVFISTVLYLLHCLIIHPFWLSPMKNIPGPYLHRVTSFPSLNFQRKHQWVQRVHQLHQKYGPVVLLSPTSISCNSSEYVQHIYVKNMPKTTFYLNFENHGQPNIFASLENKKHLQYKKMIIGLYKKSFVFANSRDLLLEKVQNLVNCVENGSVSGIDPDYINMRSELNSEGKGFKNKDWLLKTKNVGLDVYSLFSALAMDVVTSFELGRGNGSNFLVKKEERYMIVKHRMVSGMVFWTTLMPSLWSWAASKEISEAAKDIEQWQLEMYEKAERGMNDTEEALGKNEKFAAKIEIEIADKGHDHNNSTLKLLRECGLSGPSAYSLLTDNIFAGHETTAIQLTYLTYQLLRPANIEIQNNLITELKAHSGSIDNLEVIDSLPYLDALLQETLRLHAAIPGAEPRIVDKPFNVTVNHSPVKIPKGTTVSCQPYSLHRCPIFPKAEKFIPERWLIYQDETHDQYLARVKVQNRYMMAFGKGIRMCLGMNLALIEMKLAIANLYLRYHSKVSEEWCSVEQELKEIELGQKFDGESDIEKMTMFDSYTTRPWRDECWLEWYAN